MYKSLPGRLGLPTLLAIVWLVFSVSLSVWWMIFGLNQIEKMQALGSTVAEDLIRQHRMLIWEGSFLVICLLGGGGTLLYYIRRERLNTLKIKEFFASFTHDLKTALASLRLQAECLEEEMPESHPSMKLLVRLKNDAVRLQLQLENSLFLAHGDSSRMIMEEVSVRQALTSVSRHWPDFKMEISGEGNVIADERALESVLKNVVQNSIVHGRATVMQVEIRHQSSQIELKMTDNGAGFKGEVRQLGRLFHRHYGKSGSGVGLFMSRTLARKMGGDLNFASAPSGFTAILLLKGSRL